MAKPCNAGPTRQSIRKNRNSQPWHENKSALVCSKGSVGLGSCCRGSFACDGKYSQYCWQAETVLWISLFRFGQNTVCLARRLVLSMPWWDEYRSVRTRWHNAFGITNLDPRNTMPLSVDRCSCPFRNGWSDALSWCIDGWSQALCMGNQK